MVDEKVSPAVLVARDKNDEDSKILITPYGVKIKVIPVSAPLITEATTLLKRPTIPTFYSKDLDREESNPSDPEYLISLAEYDDARSKASMDVMIMFGLELVDGTPPTGDWLPKLEWLADRKQFNLDVYDLEKEADLEFLYKTFFCSTAEILDALASESMVTPSDVEEIEDSFPSDEASD